ncbi:MAG: protoheme IX farnesyltransferase [Gammaproteobacteria bacterium]|nr:protoheme IX farnesyltransferase [Gammaproteobacteria bacterium]
MSEVAVASWRDYLELTKPRVVVLMLLCALVGMLLATPELPPMPLVLVGLAGIALVAGSAAAVNHIADAKIDARMARTKNRPVPRGRVSPAAGFVFAGTLGVAGLAILLLWVNPLTAMLNLVSWMGYGLLYTLYLKRATSQNIVIGGLFGAAPPLFGWTAVTNSVEWGGIILLLIIFVWTPPHFWALAIDRRRDYEQVDVPMLPITHGDAYTRRQVLYYTIALTAVSLLPFAVGMSGVVYLAGALILGAGFLMCAVALVRGNSERAPLATFKYSIVYLTSLFAVLLVDHYLPV